MKHLKSTNVIQKTHFSDFIANIPNPDLTGYRPQNLLGNNKIYVPFQRPQLCYTRYSTCLLTLEKYIFENKTNVTEYLDLNICYMSEYLAKYIKSKIPIYIFIILHQLLYRPDGVWHSTHAVRYDSYIITSLILMLRDVHCNCSCIFLGLFYLKHNIS